MLYEVTWLTGEKDNRERDYHEHSYVLADSLTGAAGEWTAWRIAQKETEGVSLEVFPVEEVTAIDKIGTIINEHKV